MKRVKLFFLLLAVIFLFKTNIVMAQFNVFTDVGSDLIFGNFDSKNVFDKILLRPNIGVEKTYGQRSTSVLLMWKRNHGYWFHEFPSLYQSNGLRLDVSQKKYFTNNQRMFLETQLRFEAINANDLGAWLRRSTSYIVDRQTKGVQIGLKIGGRGKYIRKVNGELMLGVGVGFYKHKDFVKEVFGQNPKDPIEIEKLQNEVDDINSKIKILAYPYFQYRLHFNGKNHKKFKVYQSKVN